MGAPETPTVLARPDDARTILNAGRELEKHASQPKRPDIVHGASYVILKDKDGNERIEWLQRQFLNPTFRKGAVKLDDGKTFIAYVARHGTENTAIYAKQSPAKFIAVIDEHPEPKASTETSTVALATPDPSAPAWRQFRAEFSPTLAQEWLTWNGHNGREKLFKSTEEFAYFLEDNLPDIVEPSGAEMMQMALDFRVNQEVRYSAAQRLQDGHVEMQFQSIVEGTAAGRAGTIRIPETFRIEVPVFAGVDCHIYSVDARFRYRLSQQGLVLWYELVRPHKVLELAFKDLWMEIGDGTAKDILLGTPE